VNEKKPKNNLKISINTFAEWIDSPISFIEDMWGLIPQPLICDSKDSSSWTNPLNTFKPHKHGFHCYGEFIRGKYITWQQHQVLLGVEQAIQGKKPKRISVVSGHGIGKDALLAWLIHWFLFTRENAQIGCTAPTSDQMYDVLWKELSVWHGRLPKGIKEKFEWSTTHFKITERPEIWWARARTARKEAPEAFAGLHGEHVMLLGDEASGVPDEIFRTGEGSLTNKDVLVVLVGNPMRLEGFFYDTHNKDKENWQRFSFSSEDSPIVERDFCERIKSRYGEDSDEYRYMVLGLFPKESGMEEGGWLPLLSEEQLKYASDIGSFRNPKLGFDPAGAGQNKGIHVLRDSFKAKVASEEDISTPKSRAERTLTLITNYGVKHEDVSIDNFGIGANVAMDIAIADGKRVNAVNTGDPADDNERFLDKRAEDAWRAREWLIAGGQLIRHDGWKQLLKIRYKRTMRGKIQVMSKDEMRKRGLIRQSESIDIADGFFLTFENERYSVRKGREEGLSDAETAKLTNVY